MFWAYELFGRLGGTLLGYRISNLKRCEDMEVQELCTLLHRKETDVSALVECFDASVLRT